MKVKRFLILMIVLLSVVLLSSCEMINDFISSRMRPIPLIQIYNSNMEKTLKMIPNDTLYVQVQGLAPDSEYRIECLDPQDKMITQAVVFSDSEGRIGMLPLWYDIGFQIDPDTLQLYLPEEDISAKAFHIRVVDNTDETASRGATDFRLPFFFISTNADVDRPQPIVMGVKKVNLTGGEIDYTLENVFYSDRQDLSVLDYSEAKDDEGNISPYVPHTKELFVQVDQMTNLADEEDSDVRIWILPSINEPYEEGTWLDSKALFYQNFKVSDLVDTEGVSTPVQIHWPEAMPSYPANVEDVTHQLQIPQWAEGREFSIFVDMQDNEEFGRYEIRQEGYTSYYLDGIDGNGVAGFAVSPFVEPDADYHSLQLASNGYYSYNYSTRKYDFAYADSFKQDGTDTKYKYWYGVPYGVKVSWNPYIVYPRYSWYHPYGAEQQLESVYYGRYVDVYVAKVGEQTSFAPDTPISRYEHAPKVTIPVQYSCQNGSGQQTVWRAPYGGSNNAEVLGDYYIIVDMDRDGNITDGDLIDDVRKDEATDKGGFSVVAN